MGVLPIYNVLAVDIVTAMLAIIPLLFVHIPQPVKKLEGLITPKQLVLDVREGFRYISQWPGMLVILGMATLINMLFQSCLQLDAVDGHAHLSWGRNAVWPDELRLWGWRDPGRD